MKFLQARFTTADDNFHTDGNKAVTFVTNKPWLRATKTVQPILYCLLDADNSKKYFFFWFWFAEIKIKYVNWDFKNQISLDFLSEILCISYYLPVTWITTFHVFVINTRQFYLSTNAVPKL